MTDSYGKDGQLWKRRAVTEKTGSYGKDGHLWQSNKIVNKIINKSNEIINKAFKSEIFYVKIRSI